MEWEYEVDESRRVERGHPGFEGVLEDAFETCEWRECTEALEVALG